MNVWTDPHSTLAVTTNCAGCVFYLCASWRSAHDSRTLLDTCTHLSPWMQRSVEACLVSPSPSRLRLLQCTLLSLLTSGEAPAGSGTERSTARDWLQQGPHSRVISFSCPFWIAIYVLSMCYVWIATWIAAAKLSR